MKRRIILKKLIALGCIELEKRNSGSHYKWRNPSLPDKSTVISYNSNEFAVHTVKKIVKQLGIEWEDFMNA